MWYVVTMQINRMFVKYLQMISPMEKEQTLAGGPLGSSGPCPLDQSHLSWQTIHYKAESSQTVYL